MPKFRLSKLVRDKIVDHQLASGSKPKYRRLTLEEHKHALINKVIEEIQEMSRVEASEWLLKSPTCNRLLMTCNDILQAQKAKNAKSGAFKKGLFIDYVEVEENDPWVAYYRKDPARFPEIT